MFFLNRKRKIDNTIFEQLKADSVKMRAEYKDRIFVPVSIFEAQNRYSSAQIKTKRESQKELAEGMQQVLLNAKG